ncbi:MAG: hypothetical protein RLZZ50_1369 [Verrucomicrobiota bacterium]
MFPLVRLAFSFVLLAGPLFATMPDKTLPPVHIVSNFHPASSGWLANWSAERNYCANTYLAHLDRVDSDPNYAFVLSEVNNLIAIHNFAPARFDELKRRVHEGRVELVNGFFIEATMSLGGGELYAKMGVEGLRWQQALLGARPRFAWCIDICGTPDQQAQITEQLGLEGLVFTRNNRREADANSFWAVSPDGTRTLVVAPTHYSDFGPTGISLVYGEKDPLTREQLQHQADYFAQRAKATPPGAPVLILGGKGDYSLPPARKEYPSEFIEQWRAFRPETPLRFSTFSAYFDALAPVRDSFITQPVSTPYFWNAFWVQNPRVKSWFRRSEHALQAAETAASLASLRGDFTYPVQDLYHAWLQLFLNADRNTLWGAAGGMVFEHPTSWDARDRFQWVESASARITAQAFASSSPSTGPAVFNPLNWDRQDPVDGLSQPRVPAFGTAPAPRPATTRALAEIPSEINTAHYVARIDPATGDLLSVKAKPSGRELLGGPANVLVAEKATRPTWYAAGDNLLLRPERPRLASSQDFPATLVASETDVAVTIEVGSVFHGGGASRRILRFNKNYPRIDFETELNDLPDQTVVVAEFPLADIPREIRRGVPFGFSHGAWPEPRAGLDGITAGILPAVRWSDYELPDGAGLALLDRGLPGREITGRTPVLFLYNAVEKYYGYPNPWLSGAGTHRLHYALAVRDTPWAEARIPRIAWEFNCPPITVPAATDTAAAGIRTSDNVIVEVMRRDGAYLELRLIESQGLPGEARVAIDLPHTSAALTDFNGERPQPLAAGPEYRFPVRPQQIVTLRLKTAPVLDITPLTDWTPLVPEPKRPALHAYHPEVVGHPPRGD